MPQSQSHLLRQIPSVDRLLDSPEIEPLIMASSRIFVTEIIRGVLHSYRRDIKTNSVQYIGKQDLIQELYSRILREFQREDPSLPPACNQCNRDYPPHQPGQGSSECGGHPPG